MDSVVVTKDIKWRDNTRIMFTFSDSLPHMPALAVVEDTSVYSFHEFIRHPEGQPVLGSAVLMFVLLCGVLFHSK